MNECCREMTFEEAMESGNFEHAKALYKRLECMLADNRNRYDAEISELRWEIARAKFLADKLLDLEMEYIDNQRLPECSSPKFPRKPTGFGHSRTQFY